MTCMDYEKAILKISPQGKECIIESQGRKFSSFLKFKGQ